uniref:Uncharacterized protein n=1 Tax=Setaria italica TaxID=4555 RepID=K3Y3R4_SETIT
MTKRKNNDPLHEPAKKHKVRRRMATKNNDLLHAAFREGKTMSLLEKS